MPKYVQIDDQQYHFGEEFLQLLYSNMNLLPSDEPDD